MSTSNDNIFILYLLNLVFLSGVATQLVISFCCSDPSTGYTDTDCSDVKCYTDWRMDKCQSSFYVICGDFFQKYCYPHERSVFELSNKLNPFKEHSKILVYYTGTIDSTISTYVKFGGMTFCGSITKKLVSKS